MEIIEQNKIRVNAIKKVEDKDKDIQDDKNSVKSNKNSKETFDTILSPQQKKNYLQSKDLIEKYKNELEELMKQEKEYLEKIKIAKKVPKKRSSSEAKMKIVNKDFKNRAQSHYKVISNKEESKLNKKKK